MKHKLYVLPLVVLLFTMLFGMAIETGLIHATSLQGQGAAHQEIAHANAGTTRSSNSRAKNTAPTAFMHRPYYGNQTIAQRTTSFVDHDKPWYENDGIFVRYDGTKWTNVAIGSCTGGVNCYDGHNGYDLNLWYEPVLSVAAGTVIRAGWYNPLNHNSSLGLWAAIDHGNGYVTAYGHLSALTVTTGDQVGTQWQIGTSGTTGSSTGPHLHMATYYYPSWSATDPFGWTANYPDPNVVPDNYLWVDNPGTSNTIPVLSSNGSAVYPGATLVDDGTAGWSSTGNWNTATSNEDINGNLHWTSTTSGNATATATWQPQIPVEGYYEVGTFVDSTYASSSWAPYTIYSSDPANTGTMVSHSVGVDETHIGAFQGPFSWENTGPQWISLGTYYFKAGTSSRVVLTNATGENGAQVAADGVEFVPVQLARYSESFSSSSLPTTLTPGNTVQVNVNVQNTGLLSWPASGAAPVTLGYTWLDRMGHPIDPKVAGVSASGALTADVGPGASTSIPITLHTPLLAGSYTLVYDLQQQGTWFSSQGATPLRLSMTIIPILPNVYYFAEGYTGAGTTETLSLVNPSATQANITVTFLYQNAAPRTRTYQVPAQMHSVLNINQEAGANQSVSMIVQGDQPFVAERSMYTQKDKFVAATDSLGSSTLSSTWYFAEGNTTFGWNTLLSVLNPSTQPTTINITYLPGARGLSGSSRRQSGPYTIPARSRGTILLNKDMPFQQFGFIVQASNSVAIERPEYLVQSNLRGGSAVAGATSPQTTWYFGAGNTSSGYTEHLVLANPSSGWTSAQILYLMTNGQVVTQRVGIPGQRRIEVNVNSVVNGISHATQIIANTPIIAERQDFFTTTINGAIVGSTTVMGTSSAHTRWYLAQGDTTAGHTESLALENPNAGNTQVQVVYYRASGSPVIKSYTLAANSRTTIDLTTEIGSNQFAGAVLYAATPIVVEQTMFYNAGGGSGGYACIAYGQG